MSEQGVENGTVRSSLKKTIATLETISSVVIFIMMVLTFIDVIGRYVFHKPIFGGTEIISALLALTIFSGLGVINARDEHITVELLDDRFRRLLTTRCLRDHHPDLLCRGNGAGRRRSDRTCLGGVQGEEADRGPGNAGFLCFQYRGSICRRQRPFTDHRRCSEDP